MTNPWRNTAGTASCNDEVNGIHMSEAQRQRQDEITCWRQSFTCIVQVCHVCDGIAGLCLTIYGLTLLSSHLHAAILLTCGMGTLLVLRAISGLFSLHSDTMNRCGLSLSGTYLSPLFGILFLVLSFMCMGNHAVLMSYLETHASQLHLSTTVVEFLQQHHHALWIILLVSAILELIRWWTVPILQQWWLQLDTSLGSPDVALLYTPSLQKPWWWHSSRRHHDDGLQESLLPTTHEPHSWVNPSHSRNYSIHDGMSPRNNNDLSFWSRWFGSRARNEEEGVDFQSVQEEWASRSEEDPFWWSREEEETPIKNTPSSKKQTGESGKDVSWVLDENDDEAGNGR